MGLTDGDTDRRATRKLVKKRKPPRHSSMHFPERLKYGEDAQDDVTAADGTTAHVANQSIFSMIAAAGSKTDFHARFDDESSDGDDDDPAGPAPATRSPDALLWDIAAHDRGRTIARADQGGKLVGHRSIPLPKLNLKSPKEVNYMSQSSHVPSSHHFPSPDFPKQITPRDAPVMSQMLAAQLTSSILQTEEQESTDSSDRPITSKSPASLAGRLMDIFGFHAPEEVISGSSSCGWPWNSFMLIDL